MSLHPDLLPLLVCPACRTALHPVDDESGLACAACAVVYPVDNDIPVLLIEEAVPESEWAEGKRRKNTDRQSSEGV